MRHTPGQEAPASHGAIGETGVSRLMPAPGCRFGSAGYLVRYISSGLKKYWVDDAIAAGWPETLFFHTVIQS